jgi:predicted nuclease with TOPRIM domain|tara:strand:+ start:457 stop:654 length:198 start_codon:yes stop_codon:yes gene_type:complete
MKDDRGLLDLTRQIDELKQKVHDAELETSLIKAIGQNSPEMKALQQRVKELEAQLKLKELRESGL